MEEKLSCFLNGFLSFSQISEAQLHAVLQTILLYSPLGDLDAVSLEITDDGSIAISVSVEVAFDQLDEGVGVTL